MASYLPPTETLPIFDNTVFETNNTTALTYATAKQYFITFPTAQGATTITDFIAGAIDYLSPSSGSFFEIGTNQVSGGTIRIGPTGGTAGVSVHCANMDFKNNAMNNATSNTGGDISIGNSQTSGELNIGTGIRVTSGNGGAINIGNSSNLSNIAPINLGGVYNTVTIGGNLSLTKSILLPTTTATLLSTQLGYYTTGTGTGVGLTTATSAAVVTLSTLPIGVYNVVIAFNINAFSLTTNAATPTFTTTGGTNNIQKYNIGSTTSTTGASFSGPLQITNVVNSTTLTFAMTAGTATLIAPTYSYIRIA